MNIFKIINASFAYINSIVTARMAQNFSTVIVSLEKLSMPVCAYSCVYVT